MKNAPLFLERRTRKLLPAYLLPIFASILVIPVIVCSQPVESLLMAGFLEKFARFTDWSETEKQAESNTPFIISVIGESPFQGTLEELYAHGRINNRNVQVRYISTPKEIDGSHILFVSESEKENRESILAATNGKPILVVCDNQLVKNAGCHIRFYTTSRGTLHFEINLKNVRESGLHMELPLLEIAKIAEP